MKINNQDLNLTNGNANGKIINIRMDKMGYRYIVSATWIHHNVKKSVWSNGKQQGDQVCINVETWVQNPSWVQM